MFFQRVCRVCDWIVTPNTGSRLHVEGFQVHLVTCTYVIGVHVILVGLAMLNVIVDLCAQHNVRVQSVALFDLIMLGRAFRLLSSVLLAGHRVRQIFRHDLVPILILQQFWVLLVHFVHDHVSSLCQINANVIVNANVTLASQQSVEFRFQ